MNSVHWVIARASLWRGAFCAVARHEAKQSPRCDGGIAAIPIAAIEIASQKTLAMTACGSGFECTRLISDQYSTIGRFIQADSIVPNPGNPQALNRYMEDRPP